MMPPGFGALIPELRCGLNLFEQARDVPVGRIRNRDRLGLPCARRRGYRKRGTVNFCCSVEGHLKPDGIPPLRQGLKCLWEGVTHVSDTRRYRCPGSANAFSPTPCRAPRAAALFAPRQPFCDAEETR